MASWKTITRRSFLVLGAAFAGGAAFGAYKVAEVPENPLLPGPDGLPLNPWVIINGDGVTVIAPRAPKRIDSARSGSARASASAMSRPSRSWTRCACSWSTTCSRCGIS